MKRNVWKGMLTAGALTASVLTANSALAAVDMFLNMKSGNILGESADAKHKDEIDVLAWSWGASQGTARTKKGVLPAACVQDLSFTKFIDKATADLIGAGVTGATIPTAVLTMRKAGGTQLEFLKLEMSNVSVSSFSTGGSGGEDRLTENVTLHFASIKGTYRQQLSDGQLGPEKTFQIDGGCPE
jgi:type VI secretion system secreted protein Hcp